MTILIDPYVIGAGVLTCLFVFGLIVYWCITE